MTNGEKIKAIFPNAQIDEGMLEMYVWLDHEPAQFTKDWWNAEYKEPTTKNDLADDKTFYEQIVEYCNEHFLVLVEKDVWEDAKKALTTKNDLRVDSTPHFISFKEMMDNLKITAEDIENAEDLEYSIEPLIRPKNDLGVDYIDRNSIKYYPGTGGYMYASKGEIDKLPSVTPQEPRKGHWVVQPSNKEQGERDFIWWKCSECGQVIFSETEKDRKEFHAFCSRCGANMESEESK